MHEFLDIPCDENTVVILYNVFIGRDPEPGHPWIGLTEMELLQGLITSEEFDLKCNAWLHEGLDELLDDRNDAIIDAATAFLIKMGGEPPRSKSWPDLLLSGIDCVATILDQDAIPDSARFLSEMLRREYTAKEEWHDSLNRIVYFDPEWFVRSNKNVPMLQDLSHNELKMIAAMMIVNGEAELSPYFYTGGPSHQALRREIFGIARLFNETMESVVWRLKIAFKKGLLSHWLFDVAYYEAQRDRVFADGHVTPWKPDSHAYFDFLTMGDRHGVRPHWLFCPNSYSVLNPDIIGLTEPFKHFVNFGQFEERRTTTLFDPEYYRIMNPDMALLVSSGSHASLLESFCVTSYERDVAFSPDFDAVYYQSIYPDVRPDKNHIISLAHHFLFFGSVEGRNPNPYFDYDYFMTRYPWVKSECTRFRLSPFEYFLLIGRHEQMKAARPLVDRTIDLIQAKALYERRCKDAYSRSRRHPVDLTPLTDMSPVLSVIVPVHNQVTFTARFLELAFYASAELKRRSGRTMEVIVVSNGSTDSTAALLGRTSGIQYVDEARALGYPAAANLGAGLARGELIVIVNNDIEFEPNVFADLVERYFAIPNCGAVGPRILSLDLTVQEIGAFVAGNGDTFGFGRGERSSYNTIEAVNRVDYVSGCFLCLARADFEALGGFDPAFSPGYYEEVDLCLRLADTLRKPVFVDSAITITHYEHASFMKGRPPTVSHPTILRNRKRLAKKHATIDTRPAIDRIMGAAGVSRLGLPRSRVLVIEDLVPDPKLGSGFGRAAEVLRAFHRMGVAYDVAAVNPTVKVDDYEFGDVMLYRNWMPGEDVDSVLNRSPGIYSHIWVCRSHNLSRYHGVFKAYKDRWDAKIICDTEAVSVQRSVELARLQRTPPTDERVSDLVAAEFDGSGIVDLFIAVNERDAALLKCAGLRNTAIISHTVSGIVPSTKPRCDRTRLLFVGAVHSPLAPNFDSLKWFLRGAGAILARHNIKVTLVGYWDQAILHEFLDQDTAAKIEVLGMVSEARLSQLYDEAIVALAPTRYSAGIPCKVVESMLTGVPIVMTELLADQVGVEADLRGDLAIARIDAKAEDYSRILDRLIEDEPWWNVVRKTQSDYANRRFAQPIFDRDVQTVLERVGVLWAY